jgi:cell shape-determining protein MreC
MKKVDWIDSEVYTPRHFVALFSSNLSSSQDIAQQTNEFTVLWTLGQGHS